MRSELAKYGAILAVMIAVAGGAEAGCACGGGGGSSGSSGTWSGQSWLGDSMSQELGGSATSTGTEAETDAEGMAMSDVNGDISSSFISAQELVEMLEDETKPVIAYVSNNPPQGASYIEGSINLSSGRFIQKDDSGNETLKSVSDMAAVLGNAGINEEDAVALYSDCFPCGDSTFVLWTMLYLGHQNVRILKGPTNGLPTASSTTTKPAAIYLDDPVPELLADYESVASGEFLIVDARTPDQFVSGHIDGAVNIDFNKVVQGDWIKDDSALSEIFIDLDSDRPIAVYSENGGEASIVWYALQHSGYDARLYTWNDWLRHQPVV